MNMEPRGVAIPWAWPISQLSTAVTKIVNKSGTCSYYQQSLNFLLKPKSHDSFFVSLPRHRNVRGMATNYDCIWENPAYSEFYVFLVSYIFDKLHYRANPTSKFQTNRALRVGARALCLQSCHTQNS